MFSAKLEAFSTALIVMGAAFVPCYAMGWLLKNGRSENFEKVP